MRYVVVLGAGTAGTIVANRLHRGLPANDWHVIVVDPDDRHYYQPGFLLLPFGGYRPDDVVRPRRRYLPAGVTFVRGRVDRVAVSERLVSLVGGRRLPYDYLVVATGVRPRPDLVPGLLDGGEWHRRIFDIHTYAGALGLAAALNRFDGGRLVVHLAEANTKGPLAGLQFAFLADDWFRRRGLRADVDLAYVTPEPRVFPAAAAARTLESLLTARGITLEADFRLERVDGTSLVTPGRRVSSDLLVVVPPHTGEEYVVRSGLGDARNLVATEPHTLRAKADPAIYVLGDATDLPTVKGGSVATFAAEVLADNLLRLARGRRPTRRFDGHANCFVETGEDTAVLLDFNYYAEPLPGRYPSPTFGPFHLLEEARANHRGARAARWMYWNLLLKGHRAPVPTHLDLASKRPPTRTEGAQAH